MPTAWKTAPIDDDQVQHVPAAAGFVGVDAPRHAQHAGDVHEVEGQVEADHEEPEVPLAQRSFSIRPVTFGIPVVEPAKIANRIPPTST